MESEDERRLTLTTLVEPVAAALVGADTAVAADSVDPDVLLRALRQSKRELDVARRQFETVIDPLLIDHIVFRLGAAEKHFNYLFQLARKQQISVQGIRWEWFEED